MALTPHLESIENLFEKLEREACRAYYAEKESDQVDHFYSFCVTAHSMRDYFFERKEIKEKSDQNCYHAEWNKDKYLLAASEIANTSKHFALRDPRTGKLKKVKTQAVEPTKSGFLKIPFDVEKGGPWEVTEPDLIIILEDGEELKLYQFIGHVTEYWETYLKSKAIEVQRSKFIKVSLMYVSYRQKAEQGHAEAQYMLGFMYLGGHGVAKDGAEAATWFRRAAEQGHAEAQTGIGLAYYKGHGMPQDYTSAYMWFKLASASGDERAAKARDSVAEQMTPAQITDAQRLAREWQPKTWEELQGQRER